MVNILDKIDRKFITFKRKRKHYELNDAEEILDEIEKILLQGDGAQILPIWSRLFYERAYIQRMNGEYKAAADMFLCSGNHAAKCQDMLRTSIGKYMSVLTQFYAGVLSAENCFESLLEIDKQINCIRTLPEKDAPVLLNAKFNSMKTLADLAFECQRPDFEEYVGAVLKDADHISAVAGGTAILQVFYNLQLQARLHMAQGNYIVSTKLFATYLDCDDLEENDTFDAPPHETLRELFKYSSEEIVREYRDFGLSVHKADFLGNYELANAIWMKGLSFPDGSSNRVYKQHIEKLMQSAQSSH